MPATRDVSTAIASLVFTSGALAQHHGAGAQQEHAPIDWHNEEAALLSDHVQLTFPDQFEKAGEAYFSPDSKWIVFQAIAKPVPGEQAEADYQMFVAPVVYDSNNNITGLGDSIQISTPGSANTCGWFHPLDPSRVMFGSTLVAPTNDDRPGYQRGESRYAWVFPTEMDIVEVIVPAIADASRANEAVPSATPLWKTPAYDAEGSWSPDGRYILFTHVDMMTEDADIFIRDMTTGELWPLVVAPGYDGGPFFSADGQRIVYRSDRAGNDLLQVYVADLEFDATGKPVGISHEHAITENRHVNWGPFFHPSGEFLVYATSEIGHRNYEVFARQIPPAGQPTPTTSLASRRITHATGFDGLPVFSPDGQWMMWTSQRAGAEPGQERPSSQLWVARVGDITPR
ncbi:MAG: TolB family protein [Phycisphaerales bacterium JB043]